MQPPVPGSLLRSSWTAARCADIKADRKGKKEYEDQLGKLEREREECRARLEANRAWAAKFDEEIGPFERKYETLTGNISGLYENAKAEHRKGLDLLIQEFSYNPLFKLPSKQFHAIPFVPK